MAAPTRRDDSSEIEALRQDIRAGLDAVQAALEKSIKEMRQEVNVKLDAIKKVGP